LVGDADALEDVVVRVLLGELVSKVGRSVSLDGRGEFGRSELLDGSGEFGRGRLDEGGPGNG
jgi:hypothetical protein